LLGILFFTNDTSEGLDINSFVAEHYLAVPLFYRSRDRLTHCRLPSANWTIWQSWWRIEQIRMTLRPPGYS